MEINKHLLLLQLLLKIIPIICIGETKIEREMLKTSSVLKRQISKIFHPNGVYPIKINKTVVSEDNVRQMISFVIFYYTIFVITSVILVYTEQNVEIGVSSAIASLGNVGPAFGILGPMGNFSSIHTLSKIIFIFNMLIGRLELIPFLALLHPDFWSIKKIKKLKPAQYDRI